MVTVKVPEPIDPFGGRCLYPIPHSPPTRRAEKTLLASAAVRRGDAGLHDLVEGIDRMYYIRFALSRPEPGATIVRAATGSLQANGE